MAKDKKSFLLYCDLIHTIELMPSEKAGELFLHILKYVNDMNPETGDVLVKLAFEPIKQQLKRDLKKYEQLCNRNKINGLQGGRPKNPKKPKKPSGLFGNPTEPKKPDTDTDTDTDNDKVKVKDINEYIITPDNIKLKKNEFEKLCSEFTEEKTWEAIQYLSDYKIEKGYKTKSDNLTLRRWVFDAVDKKGNFPGKTDKKNTMSEYLQAAERVKKMIQDE